MRLKIFILKSVLQNDNNILILSPTRHNDMVYNCQIKTIIY